MVNKIKFFVLLILSFPGILLSKTPIIENSIYIFKQFSRKKNPVSAKLSRNTFARNSYLYLIPPEVLKFNLAINNRSIEEIINVKNEDIEKRILKIHPYIRASVYGIRRGKSRWLFAKVTESNKVIIEKKMVRGSDFSLAKSIHEALGYQGIIEKVSKDGEILVNTPILTDKFQQGIVYYPTSKITIGKKDIEQAVIQLVKAGEKISRFSMVLNKGPALKRGQKVKLFNGPTKEKSANGI